MAKDMLDAIISAEEEAKQRESEARKKADDYIADAGKEADAIVDNARLSAEKNAEKLFDEVKAESDILYEKSLAAAAQNCDRISSLADKNRDKVIRGAVDSVLC